MLVSYVRNRFCKLGIFVLSCLVLFCFVFYFCWQTQILTNKHKFHPMHQYFCCSQASFFPLWNKVSLFPVTWAVFSVRSRAFSAPSSCCSRWAASASRSFDSRSCSRPPNQPSGMQLANDTTQMYVWAPNCAPSPLPYYWHEKRGGCQW